MEVDRTSFYPLLLDLLTDLSTAHFVALDLELSGVPSKVNPHALPTMPATPGRPTLQQRYIETKAAAEQYTILQVGLTCVQQVLDEDNSVVIPNDTGNNNGEKEEKTPRYKYILQPYNFNLDPIVKERLDNERIFAFQSGAVEFLLKVGFDMAKPFTDGVPYLSRDEASAAKDSSRRKQDKNTVADIAIRPTDTETLDFMARVRKEIDAWEKSREEDYLNVGSIDERAEISRFEKRLVHQLVRAEYPELVTLGKRGFVQIIRFDKQREERFAAERREQNREKINLQKGFGWVVEALAGNNLSGIPLQEVGKDTTTGEPIFCDMAEYKSQFDRAHPLLRHRPRVMVGHNCFLDLVYIYQTFIGELPETVEEFSKLIHGLWPTVIDTKYLATHECGDINPASSLEEIAAKMAEESAWTGYDGPKVECDKSHDKYEFQTAFHEAGYDSMMTAQIAARLSWKLEKEGKYLGTEKEDSDGGVGLNGHAEATGSGVQLVQKMKELVLTPVKALTGGTTNTSLTLTNAGHDPAIPGLDLNTTAPLIQDHEPTSYGFIPSLPGRHWKRRGEPTLGTTDKHSTVAYDPDHTMPGDLTHAAIGLSDGFEGEVDGGMPRWDCDFWRVYGNKLRVFGTEEGVFRLV